MIKFEKMYILIIKKICNLNVYKIIKILLILCNAYIIFKNQDKLKFYINNYINSN